MADWPRIVETCRCGCSIDVSSRRATQLVREWRTGHPCTTTGAHEAGGRNGGVAAIGFAAPPRRAYGHPELGAVAERP